MMKLYQLTVLLIVALANVSAKSHHVDPVARIEDPAPIAKRFAAPVTRTGEQDEYDSARAAPAVADKNQCKISNCKLNRKLKKTLKRLVAAENMMQALEDQVRVIECRERVRQECSTRFSKSGYARHGLERECAKEVQEICDTSSTLGLHADQSLQQPTTAKKRQVDPVARIGDPAPVAKRFAAPVTRTGEQDENDSARVAPLPDKDQCKVSNCKLNRKLRKTLKRLSAAENKMQALEDQVHGLECRERVHQECSTRMMRTGLGYDLGQDCAKKAQEFCDTTSTLGGYYG